MYEDHLRIKLLTLAERVASKRGIGLASLSREIHGNCNFLSDFSAGRCSITLKKYDEMIVELRAASTSKGGRIATKIAVKKKKAA